MAGWFNNFARTPFSPLFVPYVATTGGGTQSSIQDPNKLPRQGAGVFDPSSRPQTRTDVPYAKQREITPGETRISHEANNRKQFPEISPTGTWGAGVPDFNRTTAPDKITPGGAAPPTDNNTTPGSESGPGILENWFDKRASGTDPAFEYASKRGMDALGDRYGAAGLANSGAARQGESDFMANLVSQRQGQLDALAGGASGEHQRRVDTMLDNLFKEASGRAGTGGVYDTSAASAWGKSMEAVIQMMLGKGGVDSQSNQQGTTNFIKLLAAVYGA